MIALAPNHICFPLKLLSIFINNKTFFSGRGLRFSSTVEKHITRNGKKRISQRCNNCLLTEMYNNDAFIVYRLILIKLQTSREFQDARAHFHVHFSLLPFHLRVNIVYGHHYVVASTHTPTRTTVHYLQLN